MAEKTKVQYPAAPLSEVIFGLTFKNSLLSQNNLIFDLIAEFNKKGFNDIGLHPPLSNERLAGFQLKQDFDPSIAGQVLYRCYSHDNNWLLQIQNNKILLNWIRQDKQSFKDYPGYNKLKNYFITEILNQLEKIFNEVNKKELLINENLDYCELTYQDRIVWEEYLSSFSEIDQFFESHKLPNIISNDYSIRPSNETESFTYDLDSELNGHGIINLSTNTNSENKQIIIFQCSLRGDIEGFENYENWFDKAREIQYQTFESFFNKQMLNSWKKQ